MKKRQLEQVLAAMPLRWRYYWCESGRCGCLGCANNCGLIKAGYNKKDWEKWVRQNPDMRKSS